MFAKIKHGHGHPIYPITNFYEVFRFKRPARAAAARSMRDGGRRRLGGLNPQSAAHGCRRLDHFGLVTDAIERVSNAREKFVIVQRPSTTVRAIQRHDRRQRVQLGGTRDWLVGVYAEQAAAGLSTRSQLNSRCAP
jgi:hypothetical protein